MKVVAVLFSLCLGMLLFSPPSRAADGSLPGGSPLALRKALDLSLQNSARIATGKENVIEKESLKRERRSNFLPKLSLNLSERKTETNLKAQGFTFPGLPDKIGPFSTFDARLSFNETLLNLNQLNQYYAAEEEKHTAEAELDQMESDLLYQATILFLNARKTDSSVQAEEANVALSEELLKFAEHQKETGIGTSLDVTRAQVKLAEDRQKLITAMTQRTDAILALQKELGTGQGEMMTLDSGFIPEEMFPELKESLQIALSKRKELSLQSQREKLKEVQFKAASGEKYPSINIFADYGEIGNGISDAFPTQTYGVLLSLPIYDGSVRKSHEDTIMSELRQEKLKKKDLTLQVELDVRQIYNDLNAVTRELEVSKERLVLAEKELKLSQHRFENGIGTHIELIKSQTSLSEAREALVETQFEVEAGIVKYYYVTGQMDVFYSKLP